MFENKSQNELVQILASGASFTFSAGNKLQNELVQLAAAAVVGGGILTVKGLKPKLQNELVQLSAAGKGHIVFTE